MLYRVLVRRVIDGSVEIDAESLEDARKEAEEMMGRGSPAIDWIEDESDMQVLEIEAAN